MAGRVVAITGTAIDLHVRAEGPRKSADDVASFLEEFTCALGERGLRVTEAAGRRAVTEPPPGSAVITVTATDNVDGRVWVADIRRGEARDIVMVTRPGAAPAKGPDAADQFMLEVAPLFAGASPILDAVALGDTLLVLDPTALIAFNRQGSAWQARATQRIAHAGPWPRDVRGRLVPDGAVVRVYLPGVACAATPEPLSLSCRDASEPWPIDVPKAELAPGRNYFNAAGLPPFFSAARVGGDQGAWFLVAAVDGGVGLFSGRFEPLGSASGWGSELAGITSGCGRGHQVLAVIPADGPEAGDVVRAFEMVGRQPVAVTPAATLPGSVTALWPAADGKAALAIVREHETGRYEALQLSVVCAR